MHGEDDQVVPIDASSRKSARLIKKAVEVYDPGLPHGLTATHADLVDRIRLMALEWKLWIGGADSS